MLEFDAELELVPYPDPPERLELLAEADTLLLAMPDWVEFVFSADCDGEAVAGGRGGEAGMDCGAACE